MRNRPPQSFPLTPHPRPTSRVLRLAASLLLVFTATLLAIDPRADPADYIVTHWDTERGLPNNSVKEIFQTRDGYLWLGTGNGIVRFDGLHFTLFNQFNTPGIKNSQVMSFAQTNEGSLWIATAQGLVRYRNGRFITYGEKDGVKTSNGTINALCIGPDDTLWIGCMDGITRWDGERFISDIDTSGFDIRGLRALYRDSGNTLWICLGSELLRYDAGRFRLYTSAEGLPTGTVASVSEDDSGRLTALTHRGLFVLGANGFEPAGTNELLPERLLNTLYTTQAGLSWLGSAGGLYRLAGKNLAVCRGSSQSPITGVYSILEDKEGGLWAGTANGLFLLTDRRARSFAGDEHLLSVAGIAVYQSRDQALWLASYGNGVDKLDVDGSITRFRQGSPLSHETVRCIYEAPDLSLWFGTRGSTIDHLVDGKLTSYVYAPGVITSRPVTAIHVTPEGEVLIGISRRGLLGLKEGQISPVEQASELREETVWDIERLRDGRLVLGTSKGLYTRGPDLAWAQLPLKGLPYQPNIRAVCESRNGALWLATEGGGLLRWSDSGVRAYRNSDGLPDDTLLSVTEDSQENIWISTPRGIARIAKADFRDFDQGLQSSLNCIPFGRADGLLSGSASGVGNPAALLLSDGRLLSATQRGFAEIRPSDLRPNTRPPPVFIESLFADDQPLEPAPTIRIPAGTNRLRIQYTALSLLRPERLRFRYCLKGSDSSWIEAGSQRVASYTHLSPGDYEFQVLACNDEGVWNHTGASASLVVLPLYYQTLWFRLGALLVLLLLVTLSVRTIVKRRMHRRMLLLQQEHALEKERIRIARDLHDELGADLTEAGLWADQLVEQAAPDLREPLAGLAWRIRRLATNLSGIVWTMNANHATLRHLSEFLRRYSERLFRNTGISCKVTGVEAAPNTPIPPAVQHHLIAACKEALNNTIRHAHARHTVIDLRFESDTFEIRITDDGCGFDASPEQPHEGNGLRNLGNRLAEIGGRAQIESKPSQGTSVILHVPCRSRGQRHVDP